MPYHAVELFAGCGGLALGLEKAGFETELLVEIDRHASATLKKNRPQWNVVNDDINSIVESDIKNYLKTNNEIDLLSGGYPCQAFSYAGKKLGLNDVRGTLFYSFAKALNQLKPKVFLAENVKGLVSHEGGKTLKIMIELFTQAGYHVQYKVLNAVHYNVAQKRQRVAIVGIRADLADRATYRFPTPSDDILTLKDVLVDVPSSPYIPYSVKKQQVLHLVPSGGCWRNLPDAVAKEYMGKSYYSGGGRTGMARRLAWDESALTVLCSPSQKQTERCHPDETRPFTVRENGRIQGFPDDWVFEGNVSEQYKQIGNAVPIGLSYALGCSIIDFLKETDDGL